MRGIAGSTPDHGTQARYSYGCRCQPCRAAATRRAKQRRLEASRGRVFMVPAAGTRRRIQALAVMGWPFSEIAARLGVTRCAVQKLGRASATVQAATARRIAVVYDELSMTPGPSVYTRARAVKAGWVPPLAWDDDTIDDPYAQPVGVGRDPANAPVVDDDEVARLTDAGWSATRIAAELGVSERTVHRSRIRGRREGAA